MGPTHEIVIRWRVMGLLLDFALRAISKSALALQSVVWAADKPICDVAWYWVWFASYDQLIAKSLPLLRLTDASHADTQGFQNATLTRYF